MAREFTKIPANTWETIQLNAGILVTDFDPSTKTYDGILGATSGGVSFSDSPSYTDWGDDIDNAPKNTKELKQIDSREISMSGTFVSLTAETARLLAGTADIDTGNETHIIPRDVIESTDFKDIWWVGDYGANGGFIAIHLMNALNTSGFQIQSGDREKGQFSFEFAAHYSINNTDEVPYELYVVQGDGEDTPSVLLNKHSVTIEDGGTATLTSIVVPSGTAVTWTSNDSSIATVAGGVVTAEGEGNAIITASITVDGVAYTDTCTVIVEATT